MSELNEPRPFDHAKNITVGRGRILYDETGGVKNGQWHPPGWVLPGGTRTQDFATAYKTAEAMDALMSGAPIGVAVTG